MLTVVSEYGVGLRDLAGGRSPSEDLSTYRVVRDGDLVVNKLWARFGAYGVSSLDGIISPAYWVFRIDPGMLFPKYLHYLLRSAPYRAEIGRRSKDQPPNAFDLPWSQFRTIRVAGLLLKSQQAIAEFLDVETARIDGLIETKRRLIKRLDERFRAEIDRVLVFESVDRMRLGRATRAITQGVSPQAENRAADDAEWAILKLSAVRFGKYRPHENKALPSGVGVDSQLVPKVGDLLVTRSNTPDLVGDACVVREETPRRMLCDLIYRVTLDTSVLLPDYAAYCLIGSSGRAQLEPLARGSSQTMVKLRGEDVKSVAVPLVSIEHQTSIVSELDGKREASDKCRDAIERQINLLREHREALIAAAVTGELDLRVAA